MGREISKYYSDLAKRIESVRKQQGKAVYRIRRIVLVNTDIVEEYLENFRDM